MVQKTTQSLMSAKLSSQKTTLPADAQVSHYSAMSEFFARFDVCTSKPSFSIPLDKSKWYYVFSVWCRASVVPLCCSFHVPPLYIFCPPVVPLMCSCSPSLVPLVPFLLFLSSSTLPLPFTWWHWEDLKRPYRGTLLSLFCSFEPYKITLFERNNHPISEFFSREGLWFKTP